MPVEIKELVVRFRIEDKAKTHCEAVALEDLNPQLIKYITEKCKEEILRELERKQDR